MAEQLERTINTALTAASPLLRAVVPKVTVARTTAQAKEVEPVMPFGQAWGVAGAAIDDHADAVRRFFDNSTEAARQLLEVNGALAGEINAEGTAVARLSYGKQLGTAEGQLQGMGADPASMTQQMSAAITQLQNQFGTFQQQIARGFTSTIQSAVDGVAKSIEGLLQGTMNWADALQNVGRSILGGVISAISRMVCQQEGIGLIIFDPTYKLNQHGEENSAEPVGRLLNDFEQVGREAEASVVFGHHFAKGDASAKHSIDRASGSGVWARDPDAIMMLSPHQEENCMVIEMHLRNFPQQPAIVVRWSYPCWQRAPEADPAALKGGKAQAGRPAAITPEQFAAFKAIPSLQALTKTELANLAAKVFGVTTRTVWRRLKELEQNKPNL